MPFKADHITRWSRRCLGRALTPAEFEAKPAVAREIVACVMGQVLRKQYGQSLGDDAVAVRRAAACWIAGDPEQYDRGLYAESSGRLSPAITLDESAVSITSRLQNLGITKY
jgi:hypothetical protein